MFSEVLKIKPMIDNISLNKLYNTLNTRFQSVAKKFGQHLKNNAIRYLKNAAMGGALSFIAAKLLNPLKETQDAIQSTLDKADDVVSMAEQFGSTPGKFFKLQQIAAAKDVPPEMLNMMLTKFQVALAEARNGKQNEVSNFTGQKDTADAFFMFIQSLQKMTKDQQALIQASLFGERMIGKTAKFLNTDVVGLMNRTSAGISEDKLSKRLTATANVEDYQKEQNSIRQTRDFFKKSGMISNNTVDLMGISEQQKLDIENNRIANFKNVQNIDTAVNNISGKIDKMILEIGDIVQSFKEVKNSRLFRLFTPGK